MQIEPTANISLNVGQKTTVESIIADCTQLIEKFKVDGEKTRDVAIVEPDKMHVLKGDLWIRAC